MAPTDALIDALRRERLRDAERMTFEQRFLAGAELFDYACEISKSGIRWQNPTWTEDQVMAELRRRITAAQRREESE